MMKHLFELIFRLPKEEHLCHAELADIVEIGKLHVSTNSIVVCDPLYYFNSEIPLEDKVPNGEFTTELYYTSDQNMNDEGFADSRPCFAVVHFADRPVKYWKMAVSPGQSTKNFDENDFMGYPTESGMGCFKDEKAAALFTQKHNELSALNGPNFNFYNDVVDMLMIENDQFDFLNFHSSEEFPNNVILFDIGNQGHFPSYFGFDESDQPVCLVTDFFVFDDIHYYKHLSLELKKQTALFLMSSEMSSATFADLASNILKQLFNNTGKFENPFFHSNLESFSIDLYTLLSKYILTGTGSFITLSTSIELVRSNTKSPEFILDLAADMILISLGENVGFAHDTKYAEENEKINEITYEILELESQGFYEEAIEKIDTQLQLVEELNKKTFLVYDKMAVLNNKAYYLFLLERWEEASEVATNAILEFDDAPELYHTRAEIYEVLGKYDFALKDIDKSIAFTDSESKQELRNEIIEKMKLHQIFQKYL